MTSLADRDFESFFSAATEVARLPLCPEIRLRVAADLHSLWREQEQWLGTVGLAPPYWGVPWPGGQVLARYVLDNPSLVRGRSVLDIGSGSGLCAIAAAMSGGAVTAADTDPVACLAIASNAELNGVEVTTMAVDPMDDESRWDVVLAADVWYERFMAGRMTGWLRELAREGSRVFLGDLGRAYFPHRGVVERGCFRVEGVGANEQHSISEARVWELPAADLAAATGSAQIALFA
jgi:predicted nicotinamide N-methyase